MAWTSGFPKIMETSSVHCIRDELYIECFKFISVAEISIFRVAIDKEKCRYF